MLGENPRLGEYNIWLSWIHSLRPDTPAEKVQICLNDIKDSKRLYETISWIGIDPDKQDFLPLKTSQKVVVEEEYRVQVRLPVNPEHFQYETADAGATDDFWLPRHSVRIESGRITAITRSLSDDILYLNGPSERHKGEIPRCFTRFDPAALAVEGDGNEE